MKENDQIFINPNTATIDELTQIAGVGPDVAGRIVKERPFDTLDDMARVNGIGPKFLERIKPLLTIELPGDDVEEQGPVSMDDELDQLIDSPSEEETNLPKDLEEEDIHDEEDFEVLDHEVKGDILEEETPTDLTGETEIESHTDEGVAVPEQIVETQSVPITYKKGISRSAAIAWSAFFSILAILVGMILSLGIMAGINGGNLKFVSQSEYNQLVLEFEEISADSEIIQQDLENLRVRVNNLESLSGRLSSVEKSVRTVREEIDAANNLLEEFSVELESFTAEFKILTQEINTLQDKMNRSQNFFDSMRNLLNDLFPEEESK